MSSYEFPRSSPHAPLLFNSYNHLLGSVRVENAFSPMCVFERLLRVLSLNLFPKVEDSFSVLESQHVFLFQVIYVASRIGEGVLGAHLFVFLMVSEPYRSVQPSIVLVWRSADNISIVILCRYLYCIGKQWCTTDNISFVNTCSADCFPLPPSCFSPRLLFFLSHSCFFSQRPFFPPASDFVLGLLFSCLSLYHFPYGHDCFHVYFNLRT